MATTSDPKFPCSITISIPFPTQHLANTALKALQVDQELSPLVHRSFSLSSPSSSHTTTNRSDTNGRVDQGSALEPEKTVLVTHYKAATNRMLRVSVNGFFESVAVVVQVMEELDVDVLAAKGY